LQETIRAGTVLFREGAVLPEALHCESESYSDDWRLFRGLDGCALDRKMRDEGWHFLYFAGEGRVTVLGGEGQKTLRKGISRILASLKLEKNNSFEITSVALNSFLGFQYMSVSFHIRNLQKSLNLAGGHTIQPRKDSRLVAA
jgi:hypothetical protein